MHVPSSSSSTGTVQVGLRARNASPKCSPLRRSTWTVGSSIPFSAANMRTRRGLGAVTQSWNFIDDSFGAVARSLPTAPGAANPLDWVRYSVSVGRERRGPVGPSKLPCPPAPPLSTTGDGALQGTRYGPRRIQRNAVRPRTRTDLPRSRRNSLAERSGRTCSRDARTSFGLQSLQRAQPSVQDLRVGNRQCFDAAPSILLVVESGQPCRKFPPYRGAITPTRRPPSRSPVSASDQLAIMKARSMRSRAWVVSSRPRSA